MSDCKRYSNAEALLRDLGILRPADIGVEAIALYCGAIVKYRQMEGCEASIIGKDDKAIISVDSKIRNEGRRRFSVAHEIGHWMHDRGRGDINFLCKSSDIGPERDFGKSTEARANRFAADLLLPEYIFSEYAKGKDMTLDSSSELAEEFKTSLTATAIRLVKFGSLPAMLVCHSKEKRQWFVRGPEVPDSFFPLEELHYETEAFEILYGSQNRRCKPTLTPSDLWIDRRYAGKYNVIEQTVKVVDDKVISMIWWKDESQILDVI